MEGDLIRSRIHKPEKKQEIEEEHDVNFAIESGPFYSSLIINLQLHQSLLVEASQVTAMDNSIVFIANLQDGLLKKLTKFLGKEILFINQFSAEEKPGKIFLSPGLPGNIHHYYLTSKTGILLQSSCFIACMPTVQIDTKFLGMTDFFSDESTCLLRMMGSGDLWFSSYGGILEISVKDHFLINTGYVVAFEETLDYQVQAIADLAINSSRTKYYGSQGLICHFEGEGKIWIQLRQANSFLNFLEPFLIT
jgi:uncharacterized protein (TIGR00266 family)